MSSIPPPSDSHSKESKQQCKLVDIGINLTHRALIKHWQEVIQRAINVGVTKILLTGTSLKSSHQNLKLAHEWNTKQGTNLFCTVGVHPHDAKHFVTPATTTDGNLKKDETDARTTIDEIKDLLQNNPFAIAVGECGLDYNRNFSTRTDQMTAFTEQVRLACELQMPLFIHEREAHENLVQVLDKVEDEFGKLPPVVIHCFTGNLNEAQVYLSKGYYIGFTGTICKKERGAHLRELLPHVPLDKIMVETDAPFMGFQKTKYGRFSEPAHVVGVAEEISKCHGISFEEVCEQTTKNALLFFGIKEED